MLIRRLFANTAFWSMALPLMACGLLAIVWGRDQNWQMLTAVALALLATVMIAVHHAEVIAHRVGEPFGTLVLALAVTVFPLNTHLASYSTFWGGVLLMLSALYAGSLLGREQD